MVMCLRHKNADVFVVKFERYFVFLVEAYLIYCMQYIYSENAGIVHIGAIMTDLSMTFASSKPILSGQAGFGRWSCRPRFQGPPGHCRFWHLPLGCSSIVFISLCGWGLVFILHQLALGSFVKWVVFRMVGVDPLKHCVHVNKLALI